METTKAIDSKWNKSFQLPSNPPFLLYMGNLDFNVTERDLQIFFGDLEIKNIRIIKDANDNPKGFGYVEFEELQGLKEALLLNNESLMGRKVRLDVAEQSAERRGFRTDKTAESTNWRRTGPPPEREGRERKYDKTENVSNWRRDGPPPEIDRRENTDRRSFRNDKLDNESNWRRDGPPPEIRGRENSDRRSFRNDKVDNESNWRRDGPLPEFERQGASRDRKNRSSFRSEDGNGHGRDRPAVEDKTDKVSSWRREAPLEDKNLEVNQKRLNRPETANRREKERPKTKADSVDSWRSSGTSKPLANGLKHENSNISIKLAKASRTDDGVEKSEFNRKEKASVSVNNAFGLLSNED
jgi:translation initiation factor 4B